MNAGQHFSDPAAVSGYAQRAHRTVPGLAVAHALTDLLLDEAVPADGRLLVVGAGGGLELAYLAARHRRWTFEGVDPSRPMLELAREATAASADRITLREGVVDDASSGPFDGATCLLTLHFLPPAERLRTLEQIHARLAPGAPLVVLHHSIPTGDARPRWLERIAALAARSGTPLDVARSSAAQLGEQLPILAPAEDRALLEQAGFTEIDEIFAALTIRGWAARTRAAPQ